MPDPSTHEDLREMREFASKMNPDIGPMFGRDVVRAIDRLAKLEAVAACHDGLIADKDAICICGYGTALADLDAQDEATEEKEKK